MQIEQLIRDYGYAAVLIGTLLEGDTVLALGGFAAQRGWLDLKLMLASAFAGAFGGDQLFFAIGRGYGRTLLARFPHLERHTARARSALERHAASFILANRFMIGVRIAGPFAVGLSGIGWRRFALLNAASAVLWSCVVGLAGFLFGHAVEAIIGDLREFEMFGFAVIVAIGLVVWAIRWRGQHTARRPDTAK
jgi:membrane protein DedA with SNARE-associated domain